MWNRKKIKILAKKNVKKNYWNKIFVCLIILLSIGGYSITRNAINSGTNYIDEKFPKLRYLGFNINLDNKKNNDIAKDLNTTGGTFKIIFDKTSDVISNAKIYIKSIETGITSITNKKGAGKTFLAFLSGTISLLFKFLIFNVLKVGESRFFLEAKNHCKTKFTRIFANFKKGKYKKTVKTMFLKNLYLTLWWLTIIGGIIKTYSYRMVDFIVAENPNLNSNEAITLSRKMMDGSKFKMFILDISYIIYYLLDIITFGIIGIFFLDPYMKTVETDIYFELRKKYSKELNDNNLETSGDYYPGTKKEEKQLDYYRKYNLSSFILFFFSFSFVGWVWEVLLYIIKDGKFINRGTMMGPWLPIYGFGCIAVLLLLIPKKLKKITDNPFLTFILVMIICASIEYISGFACEYFSCARWWDYTGYFLNIQGRVCLECTVFFGLGGILCIYIVAPYIDKLFKKISKKNTIVICIILISLFSIDSIYSHFNPNMGAGITTTNNLSKTITKSNHCK